MKNLQISRIHAGNLEFGTYLGVISQTNKHNTLIIPMVHRFNHGFIGLFENLIVGRLPTLGARIIFVRVRRHISAA